MKDPEKVVSLDEGRQPEQHSWLMTLLIGACILAVLYNIGLIPGLPFL